MQLKRKKGKIPNIQNIPHLVLCLLNVKMDTISVTDANNVDNVKLNKQSNMRNIFISDI